MIEAAVIPTLAAALAAQGYESLTPVQEAVIDPALVEADLLVSAQTGSGKTVGFGLAIAPTILEEDGRFGRAASPLALVIAPTRELAMQVKRELLWLYAQAGAVVASCVGGMDMRDERRALDRGAHIVVATPGRLVDHVKRGSIDLDDIRAVILDEADEMLDLGFREDLEFILSQSPDSRRTLMFSATVPKTIAQLAKSYQKDAQRITTAGESRQHSDIEYRALQVAPQDAENAIINVLRFYEAPNAIVFCNTRAMVARMTSRLSNRGFSVVALSGELTQTERSNALQAMRDGRARVCVATDVAARGIDLPNLELVVHAELPSNHETLLHRSGRTGRAGRKGVSALIVPPKVRKKAERLLHFAKLEASWASPPSAAEVAEKDEARLLSDPVWTEAVTPEESAFADKLLAMHEPQEIAAAYLRLYRTRQSAPEELADPDSRPERRPATQFGPGVWFSVSIGRNKNAEPRWLLPLICRMGGLTKDDIGAIRIQPTETYFEILETSADGFVASLGDPMELEEGGKVTRLQGTPTFAPQERGPKRFGDKPAGGKRFDKPRGDKKPYGDKPRGDKKPYGDKKSYGDKKPYGDKAAKPYDPLDGGAPERKPRHTKDASGNTPGKTKRVWNDTEAAPYPKPKADAKPKSDGKPKGDYKGGKPDGKPARAGKAPAKYGAKPAGKFGRKPEGGKPAGRPRADASDASKRFSPDGKTAKPRAGSKFAGKAGGKPSGKGKPPAKGGNAVPRRSK